MKLFMVDSSWSRVKPSEDDYFEFIMMRWAGACECVEVKQQHFGGEAERRIQSMRLTFLNGREGGLLLTDYDRHLFLKFLTLSTRSSLDYISMSHVCARARATSPENIL